MCLTTKYFIIPKKLLRDTFLKIATKDIVVYKILEKAYKSGFVSPYYYKEYKKSVLYKSSLGIIYESHNLKVHKGLHAYTTNKIAINYAFRSFGRSVHKMIIPKGSKYILGKDGTIVSNQLIWK